MFYNFKISNCSTCVLDSVEECNKFLDRDAPNRDCRVEQDLVDNLEKHLFDKNFSDEISTSVLIGNYVALARAERVVGKTSTETIFSSDEETLNKHLKLQKSRDDANDRVMKSLQSYNLTPKAQVDLYLKTLKKNTGLDIGDEKMSEFFSAEVGKVDVTRKGSQKRDV